MKTEEKPTVAVVTRGYATALGIIRSLGEAGFPVALIVNSARPGQGRIAAGSKFVGSCREVVSKKAKDGSDEALVKALSDFAREHPGKTLLIPADEYTNFVIDVNRGALSEGFMLPTAGRGENGCLTELSGRAARESLAKACGIPTVIELTVPLSEALPEDIPFPCRVRPTEVSQGFKSEGTTCEDMDELTRHINRLRRRNPDRSVVIRELPSPDGALYLGGVCLGDRIILPALLERGGELSYTGAVKPAETLGPLLGNVKAMLRSLGYTGLFEVKLRTEGERLYLGELRLCAGTSMAAYRHCGINLPAVYASAVLGLPAETPERQPVSAEGLLFERTAWESFMLGGISREELRGVISSGGSTVIDDPDDPVPGKLFRHRLRRTARYRRLRDARKRLLSKLRTLLRAVLRPIAYLILRYPQMRRKNRRDPNAERPRTLVAGRNYCSNLCMARALGRAGYEVEVLTVYQNKFRWRNIMRWLKPDAYSKYVKAYYTCAAKRRQKRIVNRLIKIATADGYDKKLLLVPVDDLVACAVDEYYDELRDYYILPNIGDTEGGISRMMSKGVQKELAKSFGLKTLGSCVIKSRDGEFEIPESVSYPCFIKPNVSKNSAKGIMRKCENREELFNAIFELAARKDVEILVEDYAEIDHEYSLLGVSTREGVCAPGFFVADEGGHAEHRGVAVTGRLLDCDDYRPLIDQLTAFIGTLGLNGLFDIDLIGTADGQMYFVEVNLRFGGSGFAVTDAGVNLPGMYADYMIYGKPVDTELRLNGGNRRFVSEKILIDEYVMGRITRSRVRETVKNADILFIRDDSDRRPYRHFRGFWFFAFIMRQVYKIRNRNKVE